MNNTPQQSANLLNAGIIAGPFFIIAALVHGVLREGFSLVRHPASLLSLGDAGWIQIANFVLTGILFILAGVGFKKVLTLGIGSKWVSRLFYLFGIALILGGIFTADPGLGFPPGAPEGTPEEMSWHGMVHGFAPILGFLAQFIALIIIARRLGSQGFLVWRNITISVAILMFVLANIPNLTADWEKGDFNFIPLWASVAIGYFWTSFVIAKVKKQETGKSV
jgi:hypothetical protein